jgi:hypothetical protein
MRSKQEEETRPSWDVESNRRAKCSFGHEATIDRDASSKGSSLWRSSTTRRSSTFKAMQDMDSG